MKDVSIVVPTYNRAAELAKMLASLEINKFKRKVEVVVVDDGSDKVNTKLVDELVAKGVYPLKLIKQSHGGPSCARNKAIESAEGKIVIFMNDDALCLPGFLKRHWDFHQKNPSEEAAVIGPFVEHPDLVDTALMRWLVAESKMHFVYGGQYEGVMPWNFFWTCNISLKKIFLEKHQIKFDETFPTAAWEDVEFGYRAAQKGLKIYFDEKLLSYHWHKFNYDDIWVRFFSHGRGLFHIRGKVPKRDSPWLSRSEFRWAAKILLLVTLAPVTAGLIKKYVSKSDQVSNIMMQYLIINEKIKGWNWEREKLK